ncbi:hypothetical protein [Nocardia gipuzkoensis]|uniref:hypothetical protein n=1 Tax=Nocardia gipuzkoensis TaxID=2749991 RepID=UPI0015EFD09E|nr:hypothetical protein [Nocardia gipuzkoensis]
MPLDDGSLYGGCVLHGTIVDGATIEAQRIWRSVRMADFDSVGVIQSAVCTVGRIPGDALESFTPD